MNVDTLKILHDVVRFGSFAAAARKLECDPSSISRAIAALENELGLRLFQRTTRQLTLTEAGQVYFSRISPLIDEFDFALDQAQNLTQGPAGLLKMTASVSFGQTCILPFLKEFKQLYPEVKLELILTDSVVDLVANGVDLACRLAPVSQADLVATRLFKTRYYVCASPDYLASNPKILHPSDIKNHNAVVFTLPDYRTSWQFKDNKGQLTQVAIESDLAISSALAIKECALQGIGLALLADWLVETEIAQGKLIPVLADYQVTAGDFDTSAWLVYPSRHFLPNKTRVMIDFLKSKF